MTSPSANSSSTGVSDDRAVDGPSWSLARGKGVGKSDCPLAPDASFYAPLSRF